MFNNGELEYFLTLLKLFGITIDRTNMTYQSGQINYVHTMLYGQALRGFDELASHNNGSTNGHLKHITEVWWN